MSYIFLITNYDGSFERKLANKKPSCILMGIQRAILNKNLKATNAHINNNIIGKYLSSTASYYAIVHTTPGHLKFPHNVPGVCALIG